LLNLIEQESFFFVKYMRLVSIKPSTNSDKKLMATFERYNGRTITTHFGAKGLKDFTIYSKETNNLLKKKSIVFSKAYSQ